ncbi:CP2 transcription factor-domain-containing protein [Absidia repens]|uniref:CP2 transcription factor-domain-containing protein n=1 Tax=Absidia repens TaxID=90262 RepID=A0A1X2HZK5_9FUNG|nr:CP2 transcription factor-domain-containing protein [Absidia repens]
MLQQQPLYLQSTPAIPTTTISSSSNSTGHSPQKEEYSSLHSSPSSHHLLDHKSSLRYEVVMEAPTAAAQKINESPLTYLNKGQAYNITLKDTQQMEGYMTSTIMIMFHDEDHRKTAPNYWKFWQTQQTNPQMARAIDIDHTKSSGLYQVECHSFDRITFRWLGNKGARLLIRFNCLSTDFSRIKGVKGIPLRLHMETSYGNEIERSYCRIKLFRDKGAERKNKDDAKNIERQLEKLRGKNGEPHPLWLTYSHAVPYTLFNKVDTLDVYHPSDQLGTTITTNAATTTTTTNITSSSSPSPSLSSSSPNQQKRYRHQIATSPPLPSATAHTPALAMTTFPLPSSMSSPLMQQQKRHYRYLTDPGYPLQPQHAHTMYHAAPPPPPPLPMLPPPPPHQQLTTVPFVSGINSHGNPWLSSPVDVDPSYTPQKRYRAAKQSLFVRFDPQTTYRAIYLDEQTVPELKSKLIQKLKSSSSSGSTSHDDVNAMAAVMNESEVTLVRQVANKQHDLLVFIEEDAFVQDIPEEQDMVVHQKLNDDGSTTLILHY